MNRKHYNHAVKTHADGLYGYALRFLGDAVAAQDVVQDCFEKLWKHRKDVNATKVKSWLFRTAHNGMINQLKRDKRKQPMDGLEPGYEDRFRFELGDALESALSQLPDVQRSILLLRDLEGYAYEEIGELLSLNAAQVKVYLFRARKKMKVVLKGEMEIQ